jgi:polyhydroxyalkanoate synthesis regulator phasin
MDGWMDIETSCTKFANLLYTFLDYFHSDAGTLGVLFDTLKTQPPTVKILLQESLDELTNKSPMMDIIYAELDNLDYIRTLLDSILMYCSDTIYLVTSICTQAKIANPHFEIELYQELWSLMEKYQVNSRNDLNIYHDEYIKKWSLSSKTPVQRFKIVKNEVDKEIDEMIKEDKLPKEQAKEIQEFIQLRQEEQQRLLSNELSKLTFMEKPIIFKQGKPITMKGEDFIMKIHKLLYIDEYKIQWLMNIHIAETFLNQTLTQLRKIIQFRFRWKDKDLWLEWLKSQYKSEPEAVNTVLPVKVVPLSQANPNKIVRKQIILTQNQEDAMKKEIKDKNQWIHCKTLNWIKNKNNSEIQAESQKELQNQWQ